MAETRKISFAGASGTLVGRVHMPPGEPRAWALFAHCFTCGKDIKAAVRISAALAAQGIATLRFDFTGLGESEGDFADTNFSSNVDDLVAAADFMATEMSAPRLLVGHSLGGAAVLVAAPRIASVTAVATIAAPCDPVHVRHLIDQAAPDLSAQGEAEVLLAGRRFRIKQQLIEDLEQQHAEKAIRDLGSALLIFHSPQDEIVSIDNARMIYERARHPKSFVSLDGADHLLRRREDAEYVAHMLATWARRYLPTADPAADDPLEEGTVEVSGGATGFANRVRVGKHVLAADEPESVKGTDTGPAPYGFLLAGLGACTSMTLRMYADRKEWPLESVRVRLRHDRVHARDCGDCDKTDGHIDVIEREVELGGALDDAQRARLMEMADRCPVHRTLENEIKIRTTGG